MSDLVSVILATIPERRAFLSQAVRYFLRQTYQDRELIVVSDNGDLDKTLLPEDPRITYVVLKDKHNLGAKLNIGAEYAKGQFFLKMDDDDWYHPEFIETAMHRLLEEDAENGITRFRRFPALMLRSFSLKTLGYYDAKCGNAMCFHRRLWEASPFRDIPARVDTQFWADHPDTSDVIIKESHLACLVRHGIRHLWTDYHAGLTVDELLDVHRPDYETPIERFFPAEDLEFYKAVRKELYPDVLEARGDRVCL